MQVVREGVEDRRCAFGREVKDVGVLLLEHLPAALERAGVLRRNAACMYRAGEDRSDSMITAVHSGTVTPVVSCPTDRVIVLPPDALGVGDGCAYPIEGLVGGDRIGVVFGLPVAGGQDDNSQPS